MAKGRRFGDEAIAVDDLDDFIKDLRRLKREGGPDGLSLLKGANYRVAEHVRSRAAAKAATLGRMYARAGADMKSSKAIKGARITAGAKVPYWNAAEFGVEPDAPKSRGVLKQLGGRNGPNYVTMIGNSRGWMQFAKNPDLLWREPGYGKTGNFLFPTMRAESETIKAMYVRELDDICKIAFPNGRL